MVTTEEQAMSERQRTGIDWNGLLLLGCMLFAIAALAAGMGCAETRFRLAIIGVERNSITEQREVTVAREKVTDKGSGMDAASHTEAGKAYEDVGKFATPVTLGDGNKTPVTIEGNRKDDHRDNSKTSTTTKTITPPAEWRAVDDGS